MNKEPITTTLWDPADHLDTEEDILNYIEAAFETDDPELISAVQDDIARAQGMASTNSAIGN
jgi:probable addiction module antidote protein